MDDYQLEYYDKQGKPIDGREWARLWGTAYKMVRKTYGQNCEVSTVWLGTDHGFNRNLPPVIFETMIFGDEEFEYYQVRYYTEEEAIAGHEDAVRLAVVQMKVLSKGIWR